MLAMVTTVTHIITHRRTQHRASDRQQRTAITFTELIPHQSTNDATDNRAGV